MRQVMRIVVAVMLVVAVAAMSHAQTGAMTPEQIKMMSGQMKMMSDEMKGGKMTSSLERPPSVDMHSALKT